MLVSAGRGMAVLEMTRLDWIKTYFLHAIEYRQV